MKTSSKKILSTSIPAVALMLATAAVFARESVSGFYYCSRPDIVSCPLIDGRFNYLSADLCNTIHGGTAKAKISEKGIELNTSNIPGVQDKEYLLIFEKKIDEVSSMFKQDIVNGGEMAVSNSLLKGKNEGQITFRGNSDALSFSCTRNSSDANLQKIGSTAEDEDDATVSAK